MLFAEYAIRIVDCVGCVAGITQLIMELSHPSAALAKLRGKQGRLSTSGEFTVRSNFTSSLDSEIGNGLPSA